MTRDEKLEVMARAWCEFNGWVPYHCPMVTIPKWGDGYKIEGFTEIPGEPIWKAHVRGMDAILRALERREELP